MGPTTLKMLTSFLFASLWCTENSKVPRSICDSPENNCGSMRRYSLKIEEGPTRRMHALIRRFLSHSAPLPVKIRSNRADLCFHRQLVISTSRQLSLINSETNHLLKPWFFIVELFTWKTEFSRRYLADLHDAMLKEPLVSLDVCIEQYSRFLSRFMEKHEGR